MLLSTRLASSSGLVTKTTSSQVISIVVLTIVYSEVISVAGRSGNKNSASDAHSISHYPYEEINPVASWKRETSQNRRYNNSYRRFPSEEDFQGESKSNSSSSGHTNNISDYIRTGELSAIFCERCTELQKKKVEQILYLLYNFNGNTGTSMSTTVTASADSEMKLGSDKADKNYVLLKKKRRKFKATSSPVPAYRKNLPEMIPTPETSVTSHYQLSRVIQLPSTLSTTTPATSSPGYSSMAIPIVPYFYAPSSTSPLPSSTVSSALEPLQSVEMPTPPMPPTTTGPVYLYYLGGSTSSSLSSSGSLEPPTTPVVESSVAYASKQTTTQPM